MTDQERIRWLIEHIRDGYGWHGWGVDTLLKDVTATEAASTATPGTHSIWQIVLHVILWREVASDRIEGREVSGPAAELNWPTVRDTSESAWAAARTRLEASGKRFVETMASLPGSRLDENVAGEPYTFADMLYGVLHHDIYHAGQVAVIRNVLRARSQS
jgi:uncharacterized damage-inducible protein DinB